MLNPIWESEDGAVRGVRSASGSIRPSTCWWRTPATARCSGSRASCASPARRRPACSARSCGATSAAAVSAASCCARRWRTARQDLGIQLAAAGIGTRNRAGYSLLTSHGFRPVRQHFLMRCEGARGSSEAPSPDLAFGVALPGDADAILELYAACGFEPRSLARMQAVLGDGRHAHAVARRDGRVVAFVELETHWPRARLGGLRRRRAGAARARRRLVAHGLGARTRSSRPARSPRC